MYMRDMLSQLIMCAGGGMDETVFVRIVKRDEGGAVTDVCEVPLSYLRLSDDPPKICIEWSDICAAGFRKE